MCVNTKIPLQINQYFNSKMFAAKRECQTELTKTENWRSLTTEFDMQCVTQVVGE